MSVYCQSVCLFKHEEISDLQEQMCDCHQTIVTSNRSKECCDIRRWEKDAFDEVFESESVEVYFLILFIFSFIYP